MQPNLDLPDNLESFTEFWPYYVLEHSHPVSRCLHVLGTLTSLVLFITLIVGHLWFWLWLPFAVGYAFAWIGHYMFERNRPATYKYPRFSFRADFFLAFKVLSGQMPKEIRLARQHLVQSKQLDSES